MIYPAEAAAAQGADVTIAKDHTYRAVWQPSPFGDRIVGLDETPDADVVVIQRPLHRHRFQLIEALQAAGIAVVVEVDDDFHAIHRRNPAWRGSSPLSNSEHNRDWLMRACQIADLVTVSTPALAARYGVHGRVRVLPNRIPERYLSIVPGAYTDVHLGPKRDGVTVGWSGSVATHPGDLEQTGGGVAHAVRETGARFGVVGTGLGVKKALGLDEEPDVTGWLPIDAYPEALARFDVGVVPLLDTPFNEAKSALKGLEMAAVGVPYVASPTGEYRRLSEATGMPIAWNPDEWASWVALLVRDEPRRRGWAERGRAAAAELTVEKHAWRWVEAWGDALIRARHRVAA